MTNKPYFSKGTTFLLGILCMGNVFFPSLINNWTNMELSTIAFFLFLFGLASFASHQILQGILVEKGWKRAIIIPAIVFGFIGVSGLNNIISWTVWENEPVWLDNQTYTESEINAGKAYLKAIHADSVEEFEKQLSPWLALDRWAFINDDPTLYLINGVKGTADTSESKWKYIISLGNARVFADELLTTAGEAYSTGNISFAADKVGSLLAIGNRVTTPQTLIQTLLGKNLIDKALKFIAAHPEVMEYDYVQKELAATEELFTNELMHQVIHSELHAQAKFVETMCVKNGTITPYAALVNSNLLQEDVESRSKELAKETPDWDNHIKRQKQLAVLNGAIAQWAFAGLVSGSSVKSSFSETIEKLDDLKQPQS